MAVEVLATRRRIIRRPRLTKLLDEDPARIKLFVAPAGYGKTTLAQEWLSQGGRRAVWYRGSPASADVAALAVGIATAVGGEIPDAGGRMRERLRITTDPDDDVDVLAELLAEDLQGWPQAAWVAIDDYHFATEAPAAERFVGYLTDLTPIQLLVTSRRRAGWATSRRILYGELQEIDRRMLELTAAEARQILGDVAAKPGSILDRAGGWPAVIALAALTRDASVPQDAFPPALHDYLADELYHRASAETRRGLRILAAAPYLDTDCAAHLLGRREADAVLAEGALIGALTSHSATHIEFHPLLREFYLRKLYEERDPAPDAVVEDLARYCVEHEKWDDLLTVAEEFSSSFALAVLVEHALSALLREGRVRTVERWVSLGERLHLRTAAIDLAEAELAFRRGEAAKAEVLARAAAAGLPETHPLTATAHIRAGQSAILADKAGMAVEYFRKAEATATTSAETREALAGAFIALLELDEHDPDLYERLTTLSGDPATVIRATSGQLTLASRVGGLDQALHAARQAVTLLGRDGDPVARTSFLNSYLQLAALAAAYLEALHIAGLLLEECRQFRLSFPVSHAYLGRAVANAGLRKYKEAQKDLRDAAKAAVPEDIYVEMNRLAIEARILCQLGRASEALVLTEKQWPRATTSVLAAEYQASRSLAFAAVGDLELAAETCAAAAAASRFGIERAVLCSSIRALLLHKQGEDATALVHDALRVATATGNFDSFVCVYRVEPDMLKPLAADKSTQTSLIKLLAAARDSAVARRLGLRLPSSLSANSLSAREVEVYELLAEGLSNKEIAQRLVISPSTVKVHVRHVLAKLGARSRSEAVARASALPLAADAVQPVAASRPPSTS